METCYKYSNLTEFIHKFSKIRKNPSGIVLFFFFRNSTLLWEENKEERLAKKEKMLKNKSQKEEI